MKRIFYICLMLSFMLSCSSDDNEETLITVDIEQGILGEWFVEGDCRRSQWTFFEDGRFDYTFMGNTTIGTYSLFDRRLIVRGFNEDVEIKMDYDIIVLTPERLKLDDTADFGIDYEFVRDCN